MVYFLLIGLLVLWQPAAKAQDSPSSLNHLSASKAVSIAYEKNPRIKQLQYQVEARRKQQALSIGLQDPQISYLREGIGQGSFSEQRWSVSQKLEFPLTSIYRYKSAKAQTGAMEQRLQSLKIKVKANVKKAYTQLAYAIENLNLAKERIHLFDKLREAAQMRSDLGESSEIDAMQADLQFSEAQNNRESAHQQFINKRYKLFQAIGLNPEDESRAISISDTLEYVEVKINRDDVLQKLSDHPQLRQYNKHQRSLSFQSKVAKSSYLPDISASYYRQDFGNDFNFYGFQVGISIPLWFGASQSKRVQKAHAQYNAARWQYEDNRLMLENQAKQAWNGYQSAKANLNRFRKNIQSKSNHLVTLTQKGYRMGELDLLRLLEAQRTFLRTQQGYYQTLRDYYLRLIELERYLQGDIIFN